MGVQSTLSAVVDVILIYLIFYKILLIIKGTRAVPMLVGLLVISLLYVVSQSTFLDLPTFNFLLEQFIGSLFLIVIILFQADLRRALASFGRPDFLATFQGGAGAQVIDELVKAAGSLAAQKIGALVVVERTADLEPYLQESVRVEAKLTKELLYAIFVPERQNPLHDGAVVVRNGRIEAAGVFLPMSVNPQIDRSLGTRHRAAIGLSEETDAAIIVVSEERGSISLSHESRFEQDLSVSDLRERLTQLMIRRSGRMFSWDWRFVTKSSARGRGDSGTIGGSSTDRATQTKGPTA